jgi:hypothetical protein
MVRAPLGAACNDGGISKAKALYNDLFSVLDVSLPFQYCVQKYSWLWQWILPIISLTRLDSIDWARIPQLRYPEGSLCAFLCNHGTLRESRQTPHNDLLGLKKKGSSGPNLMIPARAAMGREHCTVRSSSTVSAVSETNPRETYDECHVCLHSASVKLLRRNVHRVEIEFRPREDTHLGVDEGD